jgi:hypothetical protein
MKAPDAPLADAPPVDAAGLAQPDALSALADALLDLARRRLTARRGLARREAEAAEEKGAKR